MSEIDHEAAKVYAEYLGCCANNKLHNLAVAYLDLHEQIAVKDRRIEALESALGAAIESLHEWGTYIYDYFKDKRKFYSDIDRLTAVKEGRENE